MELPFTPDACTPIAGRPSLCIRVPGKVMLAGEYAVLWGGQSLAFTIDKWLTVEASSWPERQLRVESDRWSQPFILPLDQISPAASSFPSERLPIVVESARNALTYGGLEQGLALKISSDLRIEDGLGSSSAVRLGAALAVVGLAKRLKGEGVDLSLKEQWAIAQRVYEEQLSEQGFASGYDIATQLTGGLVQFRGGVDQWPQLVKRHERAASAVDAWVQIFAGGKGAPTKSIGNSTLDWLKGQGFVEKLQQISDALVEALIEGLTFPEACRWQKIYLLMEEHRSFFRGSSSYPAGVGQALASLPEFGKSWTYKTSGAGGEDAILLLGPLQATRQARRQLEKMGWYKLASGLSLSGVRIS